MCVFRSTTQLLQHYRYYRYPYNYIHNNILYRYTSDENHNIECLFNDFVTAQNAHLGFKHKFVQLVIYYYTSSRLKTHRRRPDVRFRFIGRSDGVPERVYTIY